MAEKNRKSSPNTILAKLKSGRPHIDQKVEESIVAGVQNIVGNFFEILFSHCTASIQKEHVVFVRKSNLESMYLQNEEEFKNHSQHFGEEILTSDCHKFGGLLTFSC